MLESVMSAGDADAGRGGQASPRWVGETGDVCGVGKALGVNVTGLESD